MLAATVSVAFDSIFFCVCARVVGPLSQMIGALFAILEQEV